MAEIENKTLLTSSKMGLSLSMQFTLWTAHSGGSVMMGLKKQAKFGLLLSVAGAQLFGCAPSQNLQEQTPTTAQESIIGGDLADNNFAMSNGIVGVFDTEKGATCTGSLLPNSIVLTAAHCVGNPRKMIIVFDSNILKIFELLKAGKAEEAKALARPVISAAVNSQYYSYNQKVRDLVKSKIGSGAQSPLSESKKSEITSAISEIRDQGDIALLYFKGSKPEGYKEANLLKSADVLADGATVVLAGYGIDDGTNSTGADILRTVDNIKISQSKFSNTEVLLDQRNGKGACHGDSGGPAYSRVLVNGRPQLKLWGVTSRGYQDVSNDCSHFSVYTSAVAWSDWVSKASSALIARGIVQTQSGN